MRKLIRNVSLFEDASFIRLPEDSVLWRDLVNAPWIFVFH